MQRLLSFVCFILFAASNAIAQDFNYVHYDTRDGLAGSTVYDMCQDKEGFIWFATENGLSRYDGSHFKNYTVKDGLPDNEVLKVFADSKGRVWIGSFSNEPCYYSDGVIYNKDNSKLLSQVNLNGTMLCICEDLQGNIMVSDYKKPIIIHADDSVEDLSGKAGILGRHFTQLNVVSNYFNGGFLLIERDSIFMYNDNKLSFYLMEFKAATDKHFGSRLFADGRRYFLISPDTKISITVKQHSAIYVSTVNGAWSIDTIQNKMTTHFLPGKRVSYTLNDTEGNIWFSTMGEGVYKLPSTETKTIVFDKAGPTDNSEIFSLTRSGSGIIAGLGFSRAIVLEKNVPAKVLDYAAFTGYSSNNLSTNRLYCSKALSAGGAVLGFDAYLVKVGKDGSTLVNNNLVAIKSVDEIDGEHILVGMYSHAYKLRSDDLSIVDTIWTGRCTKVLYSNGKYYIGTINGLYEVAADKTYKYLGDVHPSFQRRVTDMRATPDGTLWVATNDKGLLAYKSGKVVSEIRDDDGLSSNICKSLYLNNNFLWAGTNKGLNRIDLKHNSYPIVKYSSSDGLPSDIINALYVEDSIVWVGTPAGLTYFNEKKISHTSLCKLRMFPTTVSGAKLPADTAHSFSYKDNNIRFEYIAISFKSAGDIVYYYKLDGLDTSWLQTRETVLDYPSLPPGDYHLQLYAVNKFGVKSGTEDFVFSIAAPFWRTWWFYTLILLGAVGFTAFLVNNKSKALRQRLEEKNSFQRQFAMLEQQALQAQMNPHFIFNCLNSIQQYILINDKEKANEYLTGFASLIRQTLDNSGKRSITVSEKVRYLSSYLEMEKMRFGDNFKYTINVAQTVMPDFTTMPALLLQPYVENSLRHGIRYKQEGIGKVDISFSVEDEMLWCVVEDNGVGRRKAAELRSSQHIEYQSRGMSLTEKRIELLNRTNDRKITVEIVDMEDAGGNGTGTKVTVKIPI